MLFALGFFNILVIINNHMEYHSFLNFFNILAINTHHLSFFSIFCNY